MIETFFGQSPTAGSGYPCWLPHVPRWSHRMNHDVGDSINPVYNSLCLSVCYLPEIRSSVSQYLVQSRYRQVSLLVTVTHDPVANSLVTMSSLWWCITEWAQRYLSVIRSDKSQSRFVPTQQTLSKIPVVHLYSHPVTLWRLVHPKHSYDIRECTISWSKEMILDIRKSLANELHDLCAMLRIGSCPSHHSPNDVIPLSMTSNVHSQETMTIFWSTS